MQYRYIFCIASSTNHFLVLSTACMDFSRRLGSQNPRVSCRQTEHGYDGYDGYDIILPRTLALNMDSHKWLQFVMIIQVNSIRRDIFRSLLFFFGPAWVLFCGVCRFFSSYGFCCLSGILWPFVTCSACGFWGLAFGGFVTVWLLALVPSGFYPILAMLT